MRTNFSPDQLSDPHTRDAERALRRCVHCGFCTATCPTYVLLGDERDSPRGRIMLMQQMLENGTTPNVETVRHLDRCLSCLGCRSACPSGVDYAALIDRSRVYIEQHYTRPLPERLFRNFILLVLTRPALFAALSAIARIFAPALARLPGRLGTMSGKAAFPGRHRSFRAKHTSDLPASPQAEGAMRSALPSQRILLLPGCVQRALAPEIDAAVIRVLARENKHVDSLHATGCCGALAFHLGKARHAKQQAKAVIRACEAAERDGGADAVLISASGCAAFLKDYGTLFADEPQWKSRAEHVAAMARDFVELATPAAPPSKTISDAPTIAFHPPCSLQHGQRIGGRGEALLRAAGFRLAAIPDAHLCCGSAGSYSLLQPEIAGRLRAKKLDDIKSSGATAIVSDNIGCLTHLAGELPVFHIAELLDWSQARG
jgi:glycolate oxidase iron-sulfur subunit